MGLGSDTDFFWLFFVRNVSNEMDPVLVSYATNLSQTKLNSEIYREEKSGNHSCSPARLTGNAAVRASEGQLQCSYPEYFEGIQERESFCLVDK